MQNITKFWTRFRRNPLSSVALIALFSLLLMIPWPMGGPVRYLLSMYNREISEKTHWERVFLQPSSGLYFHGLKMNASNHLNVSANQAFVQFSWADLAFFETRIEEIHVPELIIHWNVPPTTPDGSIDFAVPTESHLQQIKGLLDSLAPVLGAQGININAKRILLLMAKDTLTLNQGKVRIAKNKEEWKLKLAGSEIRRASWPLPDDLNVSLLYSESSMKISSLNACWNGGCLKGEGSFGMGKKNSNMSFILKGVPLWPFGRFALPEQSEWRGQASGKFLWEGRIAHPNSWKAHGNVELKNVQFVQWPFQQESTFSNFVPSLSKIMKIDFVNIPKFELSSSKVKVDSLFGETENLVLHGKGVWTFPQRLDFHLKGSIQGELFDSLPRLTKLALKKEEDGGAFRASLSGTFLWQAIIPASEHYGTALRNLFK